MSNVNRAAPGSADCYVAEAGNDVATFDLDKVIHSPMDYVDGDWSDIFTSDPFQLEPILIIQIYHRLYNSDNTETPFTFKKILDAVQGCNDSEGILPLPCGETATPSESGATPTAQDDEGATAVLEPSPCTAAGSGSPSSLAETPMPTATPCGLLGDSGGTTVGEESNSAFEPSAHTTAESGVPSPLAETSFPSGQSGGLAPQSTVDNSRTAGDSLLTRVIPPPTPRQNRTSSVPPEQSPTRPVYSRRAVSIPATERAASMGVLHIPSTPTMKRTYTTVLKSPARGMAGHGSPSGRSTSASAVPSLTPILEEGREIHGSQDGRDASATSTPRSVPSVFDHGAYIPASSDFEPFPEAAGELPREGSQPTFDVPMVELPREEPNTVGECPSGVHHEGEEMPMDQREPEGGGIPTSLGEATMPPTKKPRKKIIVAESSRVLRRKRGADQVNEDGTDEAVPSTPGDRSMPPSKKRKGRAVGYGSCSLCCT